MFYIHPCPFTDATTAPCDVTVTVLSSERISVEWDGLDTCRHVNGLIVLYRVQYTKVASGVVQSKDEAGDWNVMNAETILTGLTPSTRYFIEIAAVNEEGDVGVCSEPLPIQTCKSSTLSLMMYVATYVDSQHSNVC